MLTETGEKNEIDDPRICDLNKTRLYFANPAHDVRIFEARLSKIKMRALVEKLLKMPKQEAKQYGLELQKIHGKPFLDKLRAMAKE